MKGKWRTLDRFQRGLLLFLALMTIGFTVAYLIAFGQQGIEYRGCFLVQSKENGNTLYSGKVQEKETVFTVTQAGEVTLRVGDNTFGPYTVEEDDTVSFIQEPNDKGIILYDKGGQIFRGVCRVMGGYFTLLDAPGRGWGRAPFISEGYTPNYGNPDWDPPFDLIVRMAMGDTRVTRPGNWQMYGLGLFISALDVITILWADSLFRFQMSFRVRDPEKAEPSDWELGSRQIGWVVMAIMAFFVYVMGL